MLIHVLCERLNQKVDYYAAYFWNAAGQLATELSTIAAAPDNLAAAMV